MKNIVLICLIFFSICNKSFGQIIWAPQSAKWTYGGQGMGYSYIEIKYERDSLLLGKLSKVLSKKLYTSQSITSEVIVTNIGKAITYIKDSVVYLYNNNLFDTLYSFNSPIGNSWHLSCCSGNTGCYVVVKDTGTVRINDLNLNWVSFM